jgi:hypothetical protein
MGGQTDSACPCNNLLQFAFSQLDSTAMQYHHIGIPTTVPRDGETYLAEYKVHVSGFDTSDYGIEWMRFDAECRLPELVKTVPHIAFRVDDLDRALVGKEILIAPNSPSPGVRVAFIVENGAPVEFLELSEEGQADKPSE